METGGTGLTVDGESVVAGDITDDLLSDNVALRNEANVFTVLQAFNDGVTIGTFSPRADFHVAGTKFCHLVIQFGINTVIHRYTPLFKNWSSFSFGLEMKILLPQALR